MENIAGAFSGSRDAVSQIKVSTNELAQISQELVSIISWFRTDSTTNRINQNERGTVRQDVHVPDIDYQL